jgi:transcriptional regulator with XRE-family HTH domain
LPRVAESVHVPQDPDRVVRSLGARVAERRRALGMTQEELAERLAVSVKYLQRVEGGKENLTLRSLVTLANGLQLDIAELIQRPRSAPARKVGRPRSKKT